MIEVNCKRDRIPKNCLELLARIYYGLPIPQVKFETSRSLTILYKRQEIDRYNTITYEGVQTLCRHIDPLKGMAWHVPDEEPRAVMLLNFPEGTGKPVLNNPRIRAYERQPPKERKKPGPKPKPKVAKVPKPKGPPPKVREDLAPDTPIPKRLIKTTQPLDPQPKKVDPDELARYFL